MVYSSPILVCDLMQNRRAVFVNPLLRTTRHFDLLGCRFEDVQSKTSSIDFTQGNCSTEVDLKICKKRELDAQNLAETAYRTVNRNCLISILVGEGRAFAKIRQGPGFFFAGILAHSPSYTVFHHHGQPKQHTRESSPPLVGYLDYGEVSGSRLRKFFPRPAPRGRFNKPGVALSKKKLAQVTPKEWTGDPYFVCLLLALAQLQERKLGRSRKPRSYTSRLFVTDMFDREYIHLYDTEITTDLLSALAKPKSATKPVQSPVIRRKRIPYKPYDTFCDRFSAELVAPSLGHFDATIVLSDKLSAKRQHEQESASSASLVD